MRRAACAAQRSGLAPARFQRRCRPRGSHGACARVFAPYVGFKLDVLNKIGDTKTADNKSTLLHYLVRGL
jgi:hypothetical protein